MEISRGVFHNLVKGNWCFKCGDITKHTPISSGLPGISEKQCSICRTVTRANYLEDDSDKITLNNGYSVPELCEIV